ncbi:hypothetical protein WJX75_006471 [Coccomyxa subellipsoidea]|uniref:Uncharacterized protein n=1 Tax=Coccomyxa subellipsoidea TaxID=248742 RepID=A0ABR2Z141_9CHLO
MRSEVDFPKHALGCGRHGILSAVCACKQLRSISIRHSLVTKAQPRESELLEALLISLPELRALQFKEAVENGREEPPSIFGDALIAEVCASHKRGLQLLLMDLSDFEDKFELPLSLRYIFLSNRGRHFKGRAQRLMGDLPCLEELYLILFSGRHFMLSDGIARPTRSESLRCAVFNILAFHAVDNTVGNVNTIHMPKVELLGLVFAIRHSEDEFGVSQRIPVAFRCPQLKECMFQYCYEKDLPLLKQLAGEGAPNLQTVQVAMSRMLSAIGDSPMEPFWSALNGAKNLRTLNIVFQDTLEDEMEILVAGAILVALKVDGLCLPSLLTLAFYSIPLGSTIPGPSFHMGSDPASQGARAVCNSIGLLVDAGILPSLQQIVLSPVSDGAVVHLTGPGPKPDRAPHVSTTFLLPDSCRGRRGWLQPSCSEPGMQSRALASLATLATTGTPKDVDWAMEEAEDLKQAEAQGFGCSLS